MGGGDAADDDEDCERPVDKADGENSYGGRRVVVRHKPRSVEGNAGRWQQLG